MQVAYDACTRVAVFQSPQSIESRAQNAYLIDLALGCITAIEACCGL